MAETEKSLFEQVKAKSDADPTGFVSEEVMERLIPLHQWAMEVLQARGLDEPKATKAAYELLLLDPEYTDLIGGTFDKEDVEAMRQRLLTHVDESVLKELRESMRTQFEGILHEILALQV